MKKNDRTDGNPKNWESHKQRIGGPVIMKTVNTLSNWEAFVWLWRNDIEGRWFWFFSFLKGADLRESVKIDLRDFGKISGGTKGQTKSFLF